MRYAYPMLLDLTDRLVVIVGGGAVAARKAKGLLAAGARRVRVVAPRFHEELEHMPPARVERVAATYAPAHLDGAGLVFAATDSAAVNDAVVAESRRRGVLASRADVGGDDDFGDFTTPAKLECGPLTVTVSAGSPALAARVRDELADRLDPAWVTLAAAMNELRPVLRRAAGLDVERRAALHRDLASDEAREVARRAADGRAVEALLAWMKQRHPTVL